MSMRAVRIVAIVAGSSIASASMAQVLLIPDSGNDKVWAFNPNDGSLINSDFIPTNASIPQPINAIDSGRGTILVTDETSDKILEFSVAGAFLGTFADATDGIDGPFGLTVFNNKVYVASSVNGNIVRFDLDGSNPTNWATAVGTPRDLIFRGNDVLVTESGGDDIVRFDQGGSPLGIWHNSDGVTGIDFPQQIQNEPQEGALVAGFTAPLGIYTYDASGAQTNAYTSLITSPRGVYRLGNGKILYAGGTRVRVFDPATSIEFDVVNQTGASFRFIEYSTVPAPSAVALLTLAGAAGLRRRRA